jgi:hypothetical protein
MGKSDHRGANYDPARQITQTAQGFGKVALPITIDAKTGSIWMAPVAKSAARMITRYVVLAAEHQDDPQDFAICGREASIQGDFLK